MILRNYRQHYRIENYRYRKKFTYRPPLADEDPFTHRTVSALLCCAFCNVFAPTLLSPDVALAKLAVSLHSEE